jgi:tRNA 2-thiouridine synthesizing protein A
VPEPFDPDPDETDDSVPLRELRRIAGGACADCAARYTAREAVGNIALGFKNAPRCLPCLARRLGRDAAELRDQLTDYVLRRDCYRKAWDEAAVLDAGGGTSNHPSPLPEPVTGIEAEAVAAAESWDAGDLACGELVLALRVRLNKLPPGTVFRVRATDPAAPEDIPAWCRLSGHALISAAHPEYVIRRRGA